MELTAFMSLQCFNSNIYEHDFNINLEARHKFDNHICNFNQFFSRIQCLFSLHFCKVDGLTMSKKLKFFGIMLVR